MVDISDSDVRHMVDFLRGLNLNYELGREHCYVNYSNGPVLICLDAVLQIRQDYQHFVVPCIAHFRQHWSHIRSLSGLKQLIEQYGHDGFHEVWDYRYPARAQTLESLVEWFLTYKKEHRITDDLDAMRYWAFSAG